MATLRFRGLDEYLQKLQRMQKNTPGLLTRITYEMAGIIADEVKRNIDALPAEPDTEALKAYAEGRKAPLTISQKRGLQQGFGISPMEESDGYFNVKLGFDGYNDTKTNKYPRGQPNVMIARSLESGSSVWDKHPFVRPAVNRKRKEAEQRAQQMINEALSEEMEE